jgi:hypothetical protein
MDPETTWFGRLRSVDIRVLAAIAAALMLIIGVMWVVPTTPTSNSFEFDSARRGMESAHPVDFDELVKGAIVDGSDADFYKLSPLKAANRIDVHLVNGSPTMIPGVRIFDAARNLVQEKTTEYIRNPGGSIECSFLAQSSVSYYVEILSQRNTTGPYTLSVTIQQP